MMDPERKAYILGAMNRLAATRLRIYLAEQAFEQGAGPLTVVESFKELATTQEAYVEKLLDEE